MPRKMQPEPQKEERGSVIHVTPEYLTYIRNQLREKKGLESLEEIAEAAHVGKTTVYRFFGGEGPESKQEPAPTDVLAMKLCELAEIPYPLVPIVHPDDPAWVRGAQVLRGAHPKVYADLYPIFKAFSDAQRATNEGVTQLRRKIGRLFGPDHGTQ